jgi:hypothetical protein
MKVGDFGKQVVVKFLCTNPIYTYFGIIDGECKLMYVIISFTRQIFLVLVVFVSVGSSWVKAAAIGKCAVAYT